ncbi:MAG: FAD-dependent oxidoreductase [Phycisphaerales bacterium]
MTEPVLKLYGANWCPDCRNTKRFLGEQGVAYDWIDIDADEDANRRIAELNNGKRVIPTIELDGDVLVNPSDAELAERLGLRSEASRSFYDLIVIGSGPAGLTAALYAAREGLDVLVVERGSPGGQTGVTDRLDNFPGFPDGISGLEFASRLVKQAERFGAELLRATEASGIRTHGGSSCLQTTSGTEYAARSILLSGGSTYRRLNIPGEDDLIGAGVHFCATCDGPFYRDRHVAVIGGGNSAGEESLFLTRFVERVTLLVRGEAMTASQLVIDKVLGHPKIETRFNIEATEFVGNGSLRSIRLRDTATGESDELECAAAFLFIGLSPNTDWLPASIARDDRGFITTGANLETSLPGVFAAGDLRAGSTKQAASAVGEGATAALMIRDYLNRH